MRSMSEQTETPTRRRPRGRSPNYPSVNLGVALERARDLYVNDGQHATPMQTVVSAWGYSPKSSGGRVTVAALKKFGLVEYGGSGEHRLVRLTDLAVEALEHPDPDKRQQAVQEAALRPALHKELWTRYGADLPSVDSLRYMLKRERGFTDSGASDFLGQYIETLTAAGLDHEDEPVPISGDETVSAVGWRVHELGTAYERDRASPIRQPVDQLSPMSESQAASAVRQRMHEQVTRQRGSADYMVQDPTTGSRVDVEVKILTIPLGRAQAVQIAGQFPLTEPDWDLMMSVLIAMKPGLVESEQAEVDRSRAEREGQ
jgi:hypothetical protein